MIEVTKEDVSKFIQMPSVFDFNQRMLPHVRAAWTLDVYSVLGVTFTSSIKSRYDALDADYITLVDGGSYSDDDGNTIELVGLKDILCLYALSRFIDKNQESITRKGFVKKETDKSSKAEAIKMSKYRTEFKNMANAYILALTNYMYIKKEVFSLYYGGTCKSKSKVSRGIRITGIKRS